MEQVIEQLQQLNTVYAQLLTNINAQHQHLKLLIHLLQMQQQDTATNNGTSSNETLNTFAIEAINNFTLSYQDFTNTIKQTALSNAETSYATIQTVLSNADKQYATSQAALSNADKQYATSQATLSNADKQYGINQAALSNTDKQYATSQAALSNTETSYATSQATLSNADKQYPANNITDSLIVIAKINFGKFQARIKQLIVQCTNDLVISTSKTLVQLLKNPKQTHSNLIKLTGFSKGGLSKHIIMLKKRGLIVRTAYQQYNLTSFTLQMLQDCMQ